ncbi:hypothetical protein CC78DRAFT_577426 [Lojkania enalia]|uniref:Uncharacterized protein n=1 Tax=Lojkania enalia TaxID=147567 RepID=A0A9P4KFW4_9PLEO|nr:hypothetical protein CC78DRAFT_577426 [Didymosphaeria enalia]
MDFGASSLFVSINSALKLVEFGVRIAEVGTENEVFIRTIAVVRDNLRETERLLNLESVQNKLTKVPAKADWIRNAIYSTKSALNEIGKWVERARLDQETTGSVKFETRVRWVFNDHEKIKNRQAELLACHQQLSTVLNYLSPLEDEAIIPKVSTDDVQIRFDDIISPRQKSLAMTKSSGFLRSPTRSNKNDPPSTWTPCLGSEREISTDYAHPTACVFRTSTNTLPPITERLPIETQAPPSSPPPAYTSTASDAYMIQRQPTSSSSANFSSTMYISHFPKNPLEMAHPGIEDKKNSSLWTYERAEYEAYEITPELEGDFISFSATNSQGPVNPFELFAESELEKSSAFSTQSRKTGEDTQPTSLQPGNASFSTLFQNGDPEQPPRYPPRTTGYQTRKIIPVVGTHRGLTPDQKNSSSRGSVTRDDIRQTTDTLNAIEKSDNTRMTIRSGTQAELPASYRGPIGSITLIQPQITGPPATLPRPLSSPYMPTMTSAVTQSTPGLDHISSEPIPVSSTISPTIKALTHETTGDIFLKTNAESEIVYGYAGKP